MEDFTLRNNFGTVYHIAKANQIQFSFQISNVAQGTEKKSITMELKKQLSNLRWKTVTDQQHKNLA